MSHSTLGSLNCKNELQRRACEGIESITGRNMAPEDSATGLHVYLSYIFNEIENATAVSRSSTRSAGIFNLNNRKNFECPQVLKDATSEFPAR